MDARPSDVRGTMRARIAVGAFAALLSFGAVPDEDPFERALSLAGEKRDAEAREVLDAVLERDPGHAQGRLLHGVLHARAGQVGEAIAIFEALRREHPEMAEPYNNLAVLYALEGRLEEARAALLVILERHPDPVAYANLGDVYAKLARHAYERAQALESASGGGGTGEAESAFAAPSPSRGSAGTAAGGDGPGPGTPAVESGVAMAKPAGAGPEPVVAVSKPAGAGPEPVVAVSKPAGTDSGTVVAVSKPAVADPGTVVAVSAGTAPQVLCARAGGFGGRRAVAEAALWLQSQGAEVLEVRHQEPRVTGPWRVYLPPFASPQAAEAKLREIRAGGVRDVALLRDGELANGISFGVYGEAANLQRRVAALERLGYAVRSRAAEVEAERVEAYELKARTAGAAAAFEAAWASRFPERPLQVEDCG